MDFEKIIHTICDPFLINKDALMVRVQEEGANDVTVIVVAENEDTARLIGKKGTVANALRDVVSVAGKAENKHIHLKFESFDEDK